MKVIVYFDSTGDQVTLEGVREAVFNSGSGLLQVSLTDTGRAAQVIRDFDAYRISKH